MTTTPPADAPFQIVRTLAAPRELVFRAWTHAEHLAAWFGPVGFAMVSAKMDFRPGGVFHYGLRAPDGALMWGKWTFREVDPPQAFSFVMAFSDEHGGLTRHPMSPEWPLEMLSVVRFEETGERQTRVVLSSQPHHASAREAQVFFEGFASMDGGWGGTFRQLEAWLAEAQA